MRRPSGPIGFVAVVLGLWVAARSGVVLWLGDAEAGGSPPVSLAALPSRAPAGWQLTSSSIGERSLILAAVSPTRPIGHIGNACLDPARHERFVVSSEVGSADKEAPGSLSSPADVAIRHGAVSDRGSNPFESHTSRFSASAWAFARSGSGSSLAGVGQLGGSQAGLRLAYALGRDPSAGLALFGRLSAPIEQRRGKEAAVGVEWRPSTALPVRIVAERRVGLDRGGRDAFALGLVGGVDQVALPLKFRLDAYGQAGVVGVRTRDAYVDGSVRIERHVARLGPIDVAAGGGLWGGAQPGAARLDVGPQLVLRVPVADRILKLSVDWRARVAGDARPGSGLAATFATDF